MAHHVLHSRWPSLASNCPVRLITRRCEYCGEQAGLSPDSRNLQSGVGGMTCNEVRIFIKHGKCRSGFIQGSGKLRAPPRIPQKQCW